jgi:hypothetical protein
MLTELIPLSHVVPPRRQGGMGHRQREPESHSCQDRGTDDTYHYVRNCEHVPAMFRKKNREHAVATCPMRDKDAIKRVETELDNYLLG